jgi:hypothetical protein
VQFTQFCAGSVLTALLVFSSISCQSSGPTLYPVSGTVILDPIGSASAFKPSGTVGADGAFTITTHPHGTGAPAGEYAVLITWFPANARQTDNPKSKLPAKYADPTKTPVPKVTVKPGGVTVPPIKLTPK